MDNMENQYHVNWSTAILTDYCWTQKYFANTLKATSQKKWWLMIRCNLRYFWVVCKWINFKKTYPIQAISCHIRDQYISFIRDWLCSSRKQDLFENFLPDDISHNKIIQPIFLTVSIFVQLSQLFFRLESNLCCRHLRL